MKSDIFYLPPMPDNLNCGVIPKWDMQNLVHRICPTCEKDSPQVICVRPDKLKIHKCDYCSMIYLADIPNKTDLEKLYTSYGEYKGYAMRNRKQNAYSFIQKFKLCRENFFIQILENFDGLTDMKLCEIGASYGNFLQLARFRGAKVTAIELDDNAIFYMNKYLKIKSYHNISELLEIQDIICAKSVFEHLPFPGKILKEISNKLTKDGRLLLSFPNGLNYNVLGATWAGFRVDLEHLNYWAPKTIASLLAQYGFWVEQYWELNQLSTNRRNTKQNIRNKLLIKRFPAHTGCATLAVLARHVK